MLAKMILDSLRSVIVFYIIWKQMQICTSERQPFAKLLPDNNCLVYYIDTPNSENSVSSYEHRSYENVILSLEDDQSNGYNLSFILNNRNSKQLHWNRFKSSCVVVLVEKLLRSSFNATISLLSAPLFAYDETIIVSLNLIGLKSTDINSFIQLFRNAALQYTNEELNESKPTPLIRSTIVLQTENYWSIYCYICADNSVLGVPISGYPKSLDDVAIQNKKMNGNGQRTFIYLFSTTPGESLAASRPNCLSEEMLVRPLECTTSHLILKLVGQKLNFSKVEVADDSHTTAPGVHICIMCGYPDLLLNNPEVYYDGLISITYKHDLVAVYCSPIKNAQFLGWHTLLTPFDLSVWLCLIFSSVAVSLFYRSINHGLDIWITFVEQSYQEKWSLRLGAVVGLMIYILDIMYQSYVTSGLTAPLEERRIQLLDELYDSGYRYPVSPEQFQFVHAYLPKQLQERKFNNNATFFSFFVNYTLSINMYMPTDAEGYRTLALKKLFRALPLKMVKKFLSIFSGDGTHTKLFDVTCNQVEEPLWSQQIIWSIEGHVMKETRQTIEKIQMTGIQSFYDDMNERSFVFHSLRNFTKNEGSPFRNYYQVDPLGLSTSSINIAFFLFCYLIGFCFVIYIAEIVYYTIESKM